MGRTLAAVLFLGLLAAGGWFAYGRATGKDPAGARGGDLPAAPGSGGPAAFAESTQPPAGEAPRPSSEAVALRELIRGGKFREAVGKARGLPRDAFREPALAEAAKEAALALAGQSGAGFADRLARADESRRLLGRLAIEDAAAASAIGDRLDGLNREVLFAGREVPGVVFRHAVRPGDTLDRLLKKEWKGRVRAGHGAVLWLNSIPSPDRLRATTISVPEEPVRLLVRKGAHSLWILLGEVPVRSFPVGLGLNGRTPEGTFDVEEMMPRPDYWPPGGKRVPFGQRGNPLGTRWIGFRDTPEAQGIGIHGTEEPDSIGKDLSQGCVRLLNADVEQLFTWATVGTQVEIRP